MNLSDILILKFPSASFVSDIILQDDGQGPYIKEWNLETPKPSQETLLQWIQESELDWQLNKMYLEGSDFLTSYFNKVAQNKGYDNTMSITSYVTSNVPIWKLEAETFIAWRDQVLSQAYSYYQEVVMGQHPIPTLEEIEQMIPAIQWPE